MRILYRNGSVYSAHDPTASALLADGDRIAWVGSLRSADDTTSLAPERVIDLDGALMTPAFVDAHVHATANGLALTGLDLSRASSLTAALDAVEQHARVSRGRPILGTGWDEANWPEGRAPTGRELDRAGYGGAVYLSRVDAHSAVVSSALLASVPAELPGFSPAGRLTGRAHDVARANAYGLLRRSQIRDAQRATRSAAAALGIGCLHEMAGPVTSSEADLSALLALADEEPGPEVIGYWAELGGVARARELGAVGAAGDLFCDGSLGSHTAALREPYADQPDHRGELRHGTEQLAEHLAACQRAGLQAGFHAIGDAAIDQVLDAVELLGRSGEPAVRGAHRIEHVELVRDPARLAAAGLLASVQPMFDATWGGPHGMYLRRLGVDRLRLMNRLSALVAAGVPLAFGSDAPVTPMGPWAAIRAAVHPTDPDASLDLRTAFAAHTRGGWRAARRDADGAGHLRPGAPATFAVWDVPGPGLPDVSPGTPLPQCLRTVVRGQQIYAR